MAGGIPFTIPAGASVGQFMLAFCSAGHANGFGGDSQINPAPGWVQTPNGIAAIDLGGGAGIRFRVFQKFVAPGDPGAVVTFLWVDPVNSGFAGHLEVYSNVDLGTPILDDDPVVIAPAASPLVIAAPSLVADPARLAEFLIAMHLAHAEAPDGPWTTPTGMTQRGEIATVGAGPVRALAMQVADELILAGGPTGTRTASYPALVPIQGMAYSCLLNPACVS